MNTTILKGLTVPMLCIGVFSLLFGAGCRGKSANTNIEPQSTDPKNTSAVTVGKTADQDSSDIYSETDDPAVLAILLLTRDAQVTILRGDEKTEGIHQMELYAGDEVRVISGEAQLLYPEIGISILPAGTILTIMPSEGVEDGGFAAQILLEAGKIWTRLEHVLGSEESFSVEASNVVATVRGTAFGVSLINGDIDVTVANSQVEVTTREAIKNINESIQKAVTIAAGNAVKISAAEAGSTANPRDILLQRLRKVTATEQKDLYYRFGVKPLDLSTLNKPEQTFKWSAPINIGDKLKERLTPEQIKRLEAIRDRQIRIRPDLLQDESRLRELMKNTIRFQLPLREVILLEMQTNEEPSSDGPSA